MLHGASDLDRFCSEDLNIYLNTTFKIGVNNIPHNLSYDWQHITFSKKKKKNEY